MTCPNCFAESPPGAQQCPRCGTPYFPPPPVQNPQTQYNQQWGQQGPVQPNYPRPMGMGEMPPQLRQEANTKKIACGICGILLGSLGIHKFIYGATTAGIIMLVLTLATCGIAGALFGLIGIIEGIIYLTKSDEQFYSEYMVGKKSWF